MIKQEESKYDFAAIGERFNRYFRSKGLTARSMSGLIDKNPSLISQMVSGSRFSSEVLISITKAFPELNLDWLLYGNGAMEMSVIDLRADYSNQMEALTRDYILLKDLPAPTTNKEARDRTKALRGLLDKAFELRVNLLAEEADYYKLLAIL